MAIFGVTSKPFPKLTPRPAASPAQRRLRSGEPGLPRSETSFPAPSELILAPLPTEAAPCDPATLRHLQSIGVAVGDQLVADAVQRALLGCAPHAPVWKERAGGSLLRRLSGGKTDLLIASARLLDGDALDILARARRDGLCERLLVVTDDIEPQVIHTLRMLGVHGTVDTRVDGAACLEDAIRRVGCGGSYWSGTCLDVLHGHGPLSHLPQVLSPVELYVMAILGEGCDDEVAAGRIGLSAQAVHAYRKRLHGKLGLQHRGQLVGIAVRFGLVRFTTNGVEHPGLESLRARCVFRTRRRALAS
jgi:DNA-binding NarL/FixJ family response regulator